MFSKKILLYLLLLCTVSTSAQLPLTNLRAWYPFCGNTADRSGNTLNMNLSGPTLTTDRFGNANDAYYFNGNVSVSGNIIYRTPPMPTDTGDFTYAAWFLSDTSGNRIIISNGNVNATGCAIVTTGHNVAVSFGGLGVYLPTYITFHQWHHAVLRKTGVTYSFFVDTTIVGSFNSALNPTLSADEFSVGQDYITGSRSFIGKIDDIAVYNRGLSYAEIINLYHYNPDVTAVLGADAVVCAGFSATLTPSPQYPGLNYLWSNGSTDTSLYVDTLGSYWFSITRPYGCTATDTITYTLGSVVVSLGRDTSVCIGDTFLLVPTAPAGSTYLWSTGDTTSRLHLYAPGSYWLHVNNNGCPGSDTMSFAYSPVPVVHLGADTVLCSVNPILLGSSLTYTAPSYLWSTGSTSATIQPTVSGTYSLKVLVDGCAGADTIKVKIKPSPVVSFGPDRTACQGDSVILTSIAADTTAIHIWSTGDSVATIIVKHTGTYWLTVNDSGCIATDTFKYVVNQYPPVHLGPDVSVCEGTAVILRSTDTYTSPTYSWSTGATSASINATVSGTYTLSVTQNGCTAKDAINVTINSIPVVNLGNDTYFCSGASYVLTSAQPAGATYLWSTGSTASSISVSSTGLYGLVVTNNGCTGSDSIQLDLITVPTINLGPDTTLCQGYTMELLIDGDRATYMWSDGTMGNSYNVSQSGPVWASITNVCGVAIDTINVNYKFCDLWLPNAFTPNGDGRNDVLRVKGSLGAYSDFKFFVFNRWGVNVFLSDDINKGWDGNYNNQEQAIGTYYYMMTVKLNGVEYDTKGSFELIR